MHWFWSITRWGNEGLASLLDETWSARKIRCIFIKKIENRVETSFEQPCILQLRSNFYTTTKKHGKLGHSYISARLCQNFGPPVLCQNMIQGSTKQANSQPIKALLPALLSKIKTAMTLLDWTGINLLKVPACLSCPTCSTLPWIVTYVLSTLCTYLETK